MKSKHIRIVRCPCYDLVKIERDSPVSSVLSRQNTEMISLTNKAMFGNISMSSSVPLLMCGTYCSGCCRYAVTVLLSLKWTLLCSNNSLKTNYEYENNHMEVRRMFN